LALCVAGGWLGLRRRASDAGNARGGRRRGASKDINRVLKDMETAARTGDAASFFTLARAALEAGPRSALEAAARTDLEAGRLDARRGGGGGGEGGGDENDDVGRLLALADEVNYAGRQPTHAEFERWMEFIRDAFQRDELSSGKSS
jgi:hypothetical protein